MTVDVAAVTKIARLARIKVPDGDKPLLAEQIGNILKFVEQLNAVDVAGVAPMTGCRDMELRLRADIVDDGSRPEDILANAPESEAGFFVVPKVVE